MRVVYFEPILEGQIFCIMGGEWYCIFVVSIQISSPSHISALFRYPAQKLIWIKCFCKINSTELLYYKNRHYNRLWLVDLMSWCSDLPKEEAVYSYPKLLIKDTVETPIIPDNMRMANVRITMISESLAKGCLKRLWEAIWSIVAPRSPQVKKHSLAAQTQA